MESATWFSDTVPGERREEDTKRGKAEGRGRSAFAVFLLAMAFCYLSAALFSAGSQLLERRSLARDGLIATAVLESKAKDRDFELGDSFTLSFCFAHGPSGHAVEVKGRAVPESLFENLYPGQSFPVVFLPENPKEAVPGEVLNSHPLFGFKTAALLLLCAVLCAAAARWLRAGASRDLDSEKNNG